MDKRYWALYSEYAMDDKMGSEAGAPAAQEKTKLPIGVQLMCAWAMLLLVVIGGAIGGALGGAAYAVNVAIYKSKLPVPAKITLNLVAGFSAIGIWVLIVAAIQSSRR
jgi:hypothetical protein